MSGNYPTAPKTKWAGFIFWILLLVLIIIAMLAISR